MALIVVSGALANKPMNGGAAWTRLSWALGFRKLGHDVYFIEQIATGTCVDASGRPCDLERSLNAAYFTRTTERFGFGGTAALIAEDEDRAIGLSSNQLIAVADAADVLINISGHLTLETLKPRFRTRVFIDLDPGYTQFWHAQRLAEDRLRDHDAYFTVGGNIGAADCRIPTGDIAWRAIRQPVVLDEWPAATGRTPMRFTTIASWRGPYGRVTHDGLEFGLKAHEFRRFLRLPTLTNHRFEIALDVDPADHKDVESLRSHAWTIVDPKSVAGDPASFRSYVQASSAECSVAQGIYVQTRSGWFSDRTVRYLASGKPALVQDTGFGRSVPTGVGLVPFRTLEEAARGADLIMGDYEVHSRAARALAEEFFDSAKVLRNLLCNVGVTSSCRC
ncbi:MAG TPA: hypothetical protein VKE51_19300 [Vicinamibacterales bacterium]|nr:hypothetical protein [Vicinamibacterales bacterium]